MNLDWATKTFDELSVHELHALLRLRSDVFVVEQQCVYPDLDGQDPTALHLLGRTADGKLAAYARILMPAEDGFPHVGRVVVDPDLRGRGLAHALMQYAMERLLAQFGSLRSRLSAQCHLEAFYAGHGYVRIGPDHDLDGIPHVDMEQSG